jgi:hypothetical protein
MVLLGVVAQACNPSTQETEVRGSYVQGQPGLQSKVETSLSSIEKHFFLKKKMPWLQICAPPSTSCLNFLNCKMSC